MTYFNELFEQLSTSVVPAMREFYINELGVSLEAIQLLPVGYDYKYQAWVYPERDVRGNIIGLSYRYDNGKKTMAPNEKNKRGLIYPFNQEYSNGSERYSPGKHNFRRVADAGVKCPVCGKPDFCLVSAENPSNPQAVICGRIAEGSVQKQGESGWLHILKPGGRLTKASKSVLPDTDLPILIVEGASDVHAGLSLGFVTIGRPNCKASALLLDMPLSGRPVWVIGENDDGAGITGMDETFSLISKMTPKVKKFLPPEGIKDLRTWLRNGLTQESLTTYAEEHGVCVGTEDDGILPDGRPTTLARAFIKAYLHETGLSTLRSYCGEWYAWKDGCYEKQETASVRGKVYDFLDNTKHIKESKNGPEIVRCGSTRKHAYDLMDCLNLPDLSSVPRMAPTWIRGGDKLPDIKSLIAFKNGILDVDEYMKGRIKLYDPTPNLFVLGTFPYNFDEDVTCHEATDYFGTIFNGGKETIRLLQQWFGYCLVPDMTMEKLMMFIGRPRSGKSTTLDMLRATLGVDQCCSLSMRHLVERFGKVGMVGKLAATMSDTKSPRSRDTQVALETLLTIVGQDDVSIDRKNMMELENVKLCCRFTITMMEVPNLNDTARALIPKILLCTFPNTYVGNENVNLKPHLVGLARTGSMINWALEGLKDLRSSGSFIRPLASEAMFTRVDEAMTPVTRFVNECCVLSDDSTDTASKDKLYSVFRGWADSQGLRPAHKQQFCQWLLNAYPTVGNRRVNLADGSRAYAFCFIKLTESACSEYLT